METNKEKWRVKLCRFDGALRSTRDPSRIWLQEVRGIQHEVADPHLVDFPVEEVSWAIEPAAPDAPLGHLIPIADITAAVGRLNSNNHHQE